MPSLVIFGANGFLGKALIDDLPSDKNVRAISRNIPLDVNSCMDNVNWQSADLMNKSSIEKVLSEGDIVVNLAFMPNDSESNNIQLINNVIEVCEQSGVSRLLHCSTAVVIGNSKVAKINEVIPCNPSTPYGRTKWLVEKRLTDNIFDRMDVGILRPTAILGPEGKNLLKLANSLLNGSPIINYVKACLHGVRPMHLVPVRNVVAAILHLVDLKDSLNGNIYIVSSDDDQNNNYIHVERLLMDALGVSGRKISPLLLPKVILSVLLRLTGRGDVNLNHFYDSKKLKETNYFPVSSVEDAVREFASFISKTKNDNLR